MRITLSPQFQRESVAKFGIKTESAVEAVQAAEIKEEILLDGTRLGLFVRKIPQARNGAAILVYGRLTGTDGVELLRGFKFYPELGNVAELKKPSDVLRLLAEKFGFSVTIAGKRGHFFLNEVIEQKLPDGETPKPNAEVVQVEGLNPNQGFSLEMMMKADAQPGVLQCKVALAYCIDVARYVDWTRAQS